MRKKRKNKTAAYNPEDYVPDDLELCNLLSRRKRRGIKMSVSDMRYCGWGCGKVMSYNEIYMIAGTNFNLCKQCYDKYLGINIKEKEMNQNDNMDEPSEEIQRINQELTKNVSVTPFNLADKIEKIKQGTKNDEGKPRMDLIAPEALEELAKVYTFGAKKYADHNWRKGLKWSRVYAAVQRHLNAFWQRQDNDTESGLLHLAHAFWGIATLISYSKNRKEFDDRWEDKKE